MISIWKSILAFVDKRIVLVSYLVGGAFFILFGINIFDTLDSNVYNYAAIFSSIFGVSSALTALLFAFYTYAISSDSAFIKAMRKTGPYDDMLFYVKVSIGVNAALTLYSIPIMVLEPIPKELWSIFWWLLLVWSCLLFAAASSFIRAFMVFWIFASGNEKMD